jgi:hypothetical protein
MKLFAVACLTGATAQSGDYDDRGAVGDSDYYNAYDNYDEFGNKKKNKGQNWFGAGKQYASIAPAAAADWAAALNCWPANIEADTLVAPNHRSSAGNAASQYENAGARDPITYPNQYDFNLAPQHVYGSFEVSNRASERGVLLAAGETTLHQEDPVQRSGLGGLYQYGHDTWNDEDHNEDLDSNSTRGTQWFHYKQARHAGCLYEKSDWHYSHDTFDKVFLANYYQGYADFDNSGAEPAFNAASQDAKKVVPIWWHFFNAHVLPNNADGGAQYPVSDIAPNDGNFLNPLTQKSIPLVMANPAYEGLGYLNFVVEYKYLNVGVGQDYKEFIDSSPGGNALLAATYQAKDTYRVINSCAESDGQECSGHVDTVSNNSWNGVHGHYYYDLYMGTWSVMGSTESDISRSRTWATYPFKSDSTAVAGLFTETVDDFEMDLFGDEATVDWSATSDLVVSSFPHNNLGKDFRFNLRVLMRTHHDTTAAKKATALGGTNNSNFHSYYFYKINDIAIVFPFNVAYALYHEGRDGSVDTQSRITVADPAADAWWKTLNNDNSNHPGYNVASDPAQYVKQLDASTITGNQNGQDNTSTNVEDYQFMHRSAANVNMNIIPPVDLGTHAPNGGGYHRIRGYITAKADFNSTPLAPDWCQAGARAATTDLERICGTDFNIKGLMNTYDERRGQRGTYQEIWVQLQYALGKDGRGERTSCDGNLDARCTDANHPVQSPWPYLHFMASEIVSIQAVCNTDDVNNANTCMPQPVGAGKPNDAFYGGK